MYPNLTEDSCNCRRTVYFLCEQLVIGSQPSYPQLRPFTETAWAGEQLVQSKEMFRVLEALHWKLLRDWESPHLDRGCEGKCVDWQKMVEIVCELMAVVSLCSCFIWRKGSWDGNISVDKTFEWPDYDSFTVDCIWWDFFYFLFLSLRWERQTDEGNHLKLKEIPICEGANDSVLIRWLSLRWWILS